MPDAAPRAPFPFASCNSFKKVAVEAIVAAILRDIFLGGSLRPVSSKIGCAVRSIRDDPAPASLPPCPRRPANIQLRRASPSLRLSGWTSPISCSFAQARHRPSDRRGFAGLVPVRPCLRLAGTPVHPGFRGKRCEQRLRESMDSLDLQAAGAIEDAREGLPGTLAHSEIVRLAQIQQIGCPNSLILAAGPRPPGAYRSGRPFRPLQLSVKVRQRINSGRAPVRRSRRRSGQHLSLSGPRRS